MGYKILVAEDSKTQAARLQMLLDSNGYLVELAPDGEAAIDSITEFWPDLVISDVVMPKLNGFQLCRYIKDNPRTNHIPVVLLTALDSAQDLIRGLEAQADNFIRKPYDDAYLLSRIARILTTINAQDDSDSLQLSLGGYNLVLAKDQVHTSQVIELLLSMVEDLSKANVELADTNRRLDEVLSTHKENTSALQESGVAPAVTSENPSKPAEGSAQDANEEDGISKPQLIKLYKGLNHISALAQQVTETKDFLPEVESIAETANTCLCILDSEWDRISQQQ